MLPDWDDFVNWNSVLGAMGVLIVLVQQLVALYVTHFLYLVAQVQDILQ